MRESLIFSPNTRTTFSVGRRMLKPYWNLRCISPRLNPTISGVHADACGPFLIASSRDALDQGVPVLDGMTSSM